MNTDNQNVIIMKKFYEKKRDGKMEKNIADIIKEAEMVLVGIGTEFAPELPEYEGEAELAPYYKSRFYSDLPQEHEVIQAYNSLREMIGAKPYFAVTLNTDDLIYRSNFEEDLIVAPCGSMGKMQCTEHIVDAAPIRELVLEQKNPELAVCPLCKAPLCFHTVKEEGYLESGYLGQWNKYTKWLTCTLNRKLVILELGVGFQYPQVIRWPFEKTAFYNQKSTFVRVNSKLPQLTPELSERGVSIQVNPVQLFVK